MVLLLSKLKKYGTYQTFERRFKLVGAYSIDEEQYLALDDGHPTHRNINTNDLIGQPACPCCGNQLGMVVCECGNVSVSVKMGIASVLGAVWKEN